MSIKITLTKGEKFKAQRRRNGLTHKECAEKLGLSVLTIKHWEDDTPGAPSVKITLSDGERYYALRERLGLSLKMAAELAGMSHVTLINLEKGGKDLRTLKAFYKRYMQEHNIKIKGMSLS